MEDLLQKQILDSCKLALPDGLQDLMSDISREVLRAQPQNLLQFITDHLAALLVARENLFVASRVCNDVCKSQCYPELEEELHEVGLSDEDVEKTVKIVTDFFENGGVKESNLLIKLLKKTEIDETQLPAVLAAVRGAFLRHQVNNTTIYESSSTDSDMDESLIAAKHTLNVYRKCKEPGDNYNNVVEKIQVAYRAYNVRRKFKRQERAPPPSKNKATTAEKTLHFEPKKVEMLFPETPRSKRCSSKASSVSLAGSYVPLPSYKPYSIDDTFSEIDEVSEKEREHVSVDYTEHWVTAPAWNQEPGDKQKDLSVKKKNISFHDLPQIMNNNHEEVDEDIPEEISVADEEFAEVDEDLLQEKLIINHEMSPYATATQVKTEEENKRLSDIIQKLQRNEELARIINVNEDSTQPMSENNEALNQDDNDIIYEDFRSKTEVVNDDNDIDEELKSEKLIYESNVSELATAIKQNTEQDTSNDGDLVNEELIYEPATDPMIEKEAKQTRDFRELIAKKYEVQNDDGDDIIIEALINEPEIADIVEEEIMWYGDDYDRMKEDSECESRDGDNVIKYFNYESAAASFVDLS